MISMTKTRLGDLRRLPVGYVGSGAPAAFSGGTRVSWVQRHVAGRTRHCAVVAVQLIPPHASDNSTSVSAPRERSP